MLAVGIDLIEIGRVQRAIDRFGERFLRRVFTDAEIETYGSHVPELAARFAAKEAASKALGVGIRLYSPAGIDWREAEILSNRLGEPLLHLHGGAAERARDLGLKEWDVSLAHTRGLATAVVVAH
jgi:holo-[acyl-carrier protein] synthase